MAAISVSNVWKVFGRRAEAAIRLTQEGRSRDEVLAETKATVALRDVSFEVDEGELFVLMGLSGCGKSTLLRSINRLNTPTRGTVKIGGVDVTSLDAKGLRDFRRRKVGMVFQHFALFPHRTVLQNVAYGLEVQGVSKEERNERALAVLDEVQLAQWADKRPDELSGGMRQRVGVARALAIEPDVLLMDEPFSALDPIIRSSMQADLQRLRERLNKTIVFVTHDLDEALTLGDRIAIMRDGQIVQLGSAADIAVRPEDDFVEAFADNVNKARVLTAADVMRAPVVVLRPETSPKTAIRRMDEHGFESAFVGKTDGHLDGILTMGDALSAARDGAENIRSAMRVAPTVRPTDTVEEVMGVVLNHRYPAAVVDTEGKFLGIVRHRYLLPMFTHVPARPADAPDPEVNANV